MYKVGPQIFLLVLSLLCFASTAIAESRLTFAYASIPPLAYTNPKNQTMDGDLASLVKHCLDSLENEYVAVELPIPRYSRNLENGEIQIGLGNDKIADMVSYVHIGKTLLRNVKVTIFSFDTSFKQLADFKGKRLALNKFYNYMGLRQKLEASSSNIHLDGYKSIKQGMDMLKLNRVDGLMAYEAEVLQYESPKLYKTTIFEYPVYFVVSKKAPEAEQLINKLDSVAKEYLHSNP